MLVELRKKLSPSGFRQGGFKTHIARNLIKEGMVCTLQ